ncbi:NAD(P)H-dependent oxidoreductase [Paenibacillus melissococcoides]|uniref:NAD(P)H-dependent oxidoreductase n=1 Tax=Paenibacillus melissococcoides TaxID=2912268 RepID=A0ABM9FZK1_9BACL|nr:MULTISPECIES: NAD(P)H-dependent oxidoreductase [Paenibacillus]MEB9893182.1 NAD(P)H-dependent oxidoreductase [Bacillus cereus]CAH8244729.1 NAD(P)H-dependent oxidoreductase [Paenibacillus melissococcoides]CAH8708801.1 NAD(P)H-dependent oxidoreductase [Paenibacillus melissococcoides]CAH8709551.1 NAD(P)H-dependent oxidoreductase [Paenibacillus melissococcoides]GIO81600.1 hypothetical protein J6TS7_52100 [Paenibacillus dendritiformis]
MNIVALVGSNRKESYNLKLAAYMQKRYQERIDIDIVSIKELPFYNQDIENNPPKIDDSGTLIHEPTIAFLDSVVDNFVAWYKKHHAK